MVRRPCTRVLAVALVAGAVGACGASADGESTTKHPRVLPMTFERGGGFAGVQDRVRVGRGGAVRVTHRAVPGRSTRIGPKRLDALRTALRAAHLPRHGDYPSPPGTADAFQYRIAVPGHVVTAGDGGKAPERIRRLISRLSALLN